MVQYGSGVHSQQANVDIGYNNYNSSGVREDFFVNKGNEGVRDLQQIPVGKAFRGEVADVVGNQVTIRLDNGQSVQARLAEPMKFNIGEKVLFQVKSNSDGMIEIKPIVNAAMQGQEATILKALEAANLPINEKTIMLLQNLLKEQMPINRNSLQNMYKQILANGTTDMQTIVQMNKHHIPITKENIGQFEAYKNYEHRIAAEAEQLSTELTELLSEVMEENKESGKQFHWNLLQLFAGKQGALSQETSIGGEQQGTGLLQESQTLAAHEGQILPEQELSREGATQTVGKDGLPIVAQEGKLEGMFSVPSSSDSSDKSVPVFQQGQLGYELSLEERQELLENVKELPLSDELKGKILNGEADIDTFLKELNLKLQQNPKYDLSGLIHQDGYKRLLKSQIQNQWFVKPEQLAAGEKMEEFYEKLQRQIRQLEGLMENAGKADSPAAKTAGGMRENIDFMNQLNQMFTYVQIPLMMSGKTAHSDLYVFTKKKNLKEQEGKVSALLHLDMEGLGSLDVYVEMDGMDVKTQFKLAEQELVELFESHIDFLTKRITEKGYYFSSKVEIAEKQTDFVKDFLERDHGNTPMQRFAFDVRA